MADRRVHELARALYQGKLDRRDFVRAAASLGVSTAAIELFARGASLAQNQEATPAATPVATPVPAPPVVARPCGETCLWAGKLVTIQAPDAPVAVPLEEVRDEFEAATGARLTIVTDPVQRAFTRLVDDATGGTNAYHGSLVAMSWLGELVGGGLLLPLDDFYRDASKFPKYDVNAEFEPLRQLRFFGGKQYAVPYDGDGQILYYRRDLLNDPNHQTAFKTAVGYALPVPPRTWDQVRDIANYFNGKDNGMGGPVSGIALPLKPGGQGVDLYVSLSASFVIGPGNPILYWFDPDTMNPLCASPGHARAADMLKALSRLGPAAMANWALDDAWEHFVKGDALFTWSGGGVTPLAIAEKQPTVGKIGAAALPGAMSYVDPKTGAETKVDAPNVVGNTTGDSWAGVVMASAPDPGLAYYLFALLATEPKQRFLAARVTDRVNPGHGYQIPPPSGSGDIADYTAQGWDRQDAADYTTALASNFTDKSQLPLLRIPGAERYLAALDQRLADFLSDRVGSAADALKQAADDWDKITDDLDRETQRLSYLTMLGLPTPPPSD